MALYDDMKRLIHEETHSQYCIQVLDAIFNRPVFSTTDFIQDSGIQNPTAMGLLRQLKTVGVLKELQAGSGRRSAALFFPALLTITEQKQLL